jgi:hypothetical protein
VKKRANDWTEVFQRKKYKWPKKHLKKCLTSLTIKEIQIKTHKDSTSLLL